MHLHDKDIPTAWEHHYYVGGDDDGVVQCATLGCTVGLMSGWEWARFRTAERGRARRREARARRHVLALDAAQLADGRFAGGHVASTRSGVTRRGELPGQVARLTGVPVAHASHVGPVQGETPLGPGIPWRTEMLGESQICDRDGTISPA